MNSSTEIGNNAETNQFISPIPVIEEQMIVEKKTIETGRIIISKKVEEKVETVAVPLHHEEYIVEHVAFDKLIDELPSVRYEGNVMIIPVVKEVMVKRMLLVEEIQITKLIKETSEPQQMTLRKEVVTVERSDIKQ